MEGWPSQMATFFILFTRTFDLFFSLNAIEAFSFITAYPTIFLRDNPEVEVPKDRTTWDWNPRLAEIR